MKTNKQVRTYLNIISKKKYGKSYSMLGSYHKNIVRKKGVQLLKGAKKL